MMLTRFTIAGVALALVVVLLLLDSQRISPGELAGAHAADPRLAGPERCDACHGGLLQSMSSACLACHQAMETQLEGEIGFHGQLEPELAADCAVCHSEHHGADFSLVADRSFVQAGLGSRNEYAHEGLGFGLHGAHLGLGCASCHEHADTPVPPTGARRFLGLDQQCMSCHEDEHEGEYGTGCAECHGQSQPFAQVGGDAHNTFAPIVGQHLEISCEECHESGTRHSVAAVARRYLAGDASVPARSCDSCHSSQHDQGFLDGVQGLAGVLADQRVCQHCHDPRQASFLGLDPTMDPALHAATAFPLEGAHAPVDCAACHEPEEGSPRLTPDGRASARFADTPVACDACHESPHDELFLATLVDAVGCDGCHDATHETFLGDNRPMAADKALHDASGFALTAPHHEAACADCHEGFGVRDPAHAARESAGAAFAAFRAAFPGRADDTCSRCHHDPHEAQFADGAFASMECLGCHDPLAFRPPLFGIEDHQRTDFPLTGGHEAVGCNACHQLPEGAPESGPDGLLTRVFSGTPRDCAACHADVHGQVFDRPGLPARYGGAQGCARCHSTEAFEQGRPEDFDHALWGGVALQGAHRSADCSGCHVADRSGETPRLTFAEVKSSDCSGCHVDRHVGQFAVGGVTECGRCHQAAASFAELVFDHRTDARFALDAQHAALSCSACHVPMPLTDGTMAVRYKPLGAECRDCHDPRGLQSMGRDGR